MSLIKKTLMKNKIDNISENTPNDTRIYETIIDECMLYRDEYSNYVVNDNMEYLFNHIDDYNLERIEFDPNMFSEYTTGADIYKIDYCECTVDTDPTELYKNNDEERYLIYFIKERITEDTESFSIFNLNVQDALKNLNIISVRKYIYDDNLEWVCDEYRHYNGGVNEVTINLKSLKSGSLKVLDNKFLSEKVLTADNFLDIGNTVGVSMSTYNSEEEEMCVGEIFNYYDGNKATGSYSHAEGIATTAQGFASHAEGQATESTGDLSHAEGSNTYSIGDFSHAEGCSTIAKSIFSHSEGSGTIASCEAQHTQGKNNIEDLENKYAHIVGNGNDSYNRSNAHTLDWDGNAWYQGDVECTSVILNSSTQESTKKFRITVDDSGTITATEIVAES